MEADGLRAGRPPTSRVEILRLEAEAAVAAAQAPPWLLVAVVFLHERYRDDIRVTDAAAAAGVHVAHLAAVFRRVYGRSPGSYIRHLRVAWAAERLLDSDLAISEIATNAGFADQAHLTRWFRRVVGSTPAAYRDGRGHASA